MKSPHLVHLAIGLVVALAGLASPAAFGQTPISGPQSGTLPAGVYHGTGNISVAAAATWTLDPGVIIKFTGAHELTVNGTLNANGTAGNPVIITEDDDDSAGGDTNGNGASSGSPSAWRGVVFNTGAGGTLTYADVRFGGSGFVSNFELNGASPTLVNCTSRNCSYQGMDLNNNSFPTITNCSFQNNSGWAIHHAPIMAVDTITNNTASGNTTNSIHVNQGSVTSNLTIDASSNLTGGLMVDAHVTIPAGVTLTLDAGVNLKFTGAYEVAVDGTLLVNGSSGSPVVFTDDADDSAGGDTNSNGVSGSAPSSWRGIVFSSTSTGCALNHADVRYGGSGFVSNFELDGASPTLTNCTSRDCSYQGMDLNNNSFPTVTNCSFLNNSGWAIHRAPIMAVDTITNNTASGNTTNSVHVNQGSVTANLTIDASSNLTGGLMVEAHVTIPAGVTLTLDAGVNLKFTGAYEVTVNGTLITTGASGSPVVFTDDADDTAGGDTNSDGGASVPAGSAWRGIVFNAGSDASNLAFADARYGGSGFVSNFEMDGASPTLTSCASRYCSYQGMDLNHNSFPTVTGCTFVGNTNYAIYRAHLEALDTITNNNVSGNTVNSVYVASATLGASLSLASASKLGGGILVDATIVIPSGMTLSVDAGVIFKFMGAHQVTVNGTLVTTGTAAEPIVFTDDADDSAGGDTDTNGASVGSPSSWRGIVFNATSTGCSLTYADVRYGGSGFVSNIECNSASPTLTNCTIRNSSFRGMDLNGNSFPTVTTCSFLNNAVAAVDQASLSAVPGFTNNTASGNALNCIHVTTAVVTGPLTIGPQSILNGALLLSASVDVQAAGVLTVNQGAIFKFTGSHELAVNGAAHFRGTTYEPVVFTDDADDAFGGDTNNDGPSGGVPSSWRGVLFNSGALASSAENVLIRYTGSGFVPGLTSSSANVTLRSVRVDASSYRGFVLSALAGNAMNLVTWNCGDRGISLNGGAFDVLHATVLGSPLGIHKEAAFTGNVKNSISWGNTTNFSNFGVGAQVQFSNGGFSGMNGNINVDPQFVDAPNGDLHIAVTSPCVNTADLLTAVSVLKDHDENSRILDATLSGFPGADMGAYEYAVWEMTAVGVPQIGTTTTFTVTGPVGATIYVLGVLDGVFPYSPYGILSAGANPGVTFLILTPVPLLVGTPLPFGLPNDPGLIGLVAGIQTLTTPLGNPSVGNFTQLYRGRIRP